ncbi:MAG: magnesium and cobalt transport protein CorA [Bacteroidetes bacterium CG12_big_fil_rev_8_21_14_0_65_60_17]|nr:MAG: magnesium and cobalt transport protein CorA [Bacteroidetes bacterium CG12_big_fil_rev_8_21_14_0_65_60_17]
MKHKKQVGLAPGTLVYTGPERDHDVQLRLIDFRGTHFEEHPVEPADDVESVVLREDTTTWLDISGIHDMDLVAGIGDRLDLHKLVLEDIVHPTQRPKLEAYDDESLFIVVRMLSVGNGFAAGLPNTAPHILSEQISIILTRTGVISFQELPADVFEPVRQRLRLGKGIIREQGADYLAYALLDTIVDHYFHVIEYIGDEIDALEAEILARPSTEALARINRYKREVLSLRKSIWPLREVLGGLDRSDSGLITERTKMYLRDVYDHTIQVVDMLETYRDLLAGLTDLYMSTVSLKMNEVMQVLTIVGSIFIPLTFVAGIYGMNFEVMPELQWEYGYFAAWGLMVTLALGMLLFFKRRKWI